MNNSVNNLIEKEKITRLLNTYAEACDRRDWKLFEQVFAPELQGSYGGIFQIKNRDKLVKLIKSMLGGCGPSQHLLGNYKISIEGNSATSACYVRAAHAGAGSKKELFYEIWGEYHDKLQLSDGSWKIVHRELVIYHESGTQEVLGPE